ncbi:unnamed protein product [Caenorhabditis brenneri]
MSTRTPSTPSSQTSMLPNSSRRSNEGSKSTETEPHARMNTPTQDSQALPPSFNMAHYQQYVANLLNSSSMPFPIPTTSNQATPGQAALPSSQGSYQSTMQFFNQSGSAMPMYPNSENHARHMLEEQLALTKNELKKSKEEVVKLKKDNAMLRREAEAYKNLYDALKEEKAGGKEDITKRSP